MLINYIAGLYAIFYSDDASSISFVLINISPTPRACSIPSPIIATGSPLSKLGMSFYKTCLLLRPYTILNFDFSAREPVDIVFSPESISFIASLLHIIYSIIKGYLCTSFNVGMYGFLVPSNSIKEISSPNPRKFILG